MVQEEERIVTEKGRPKEEEKRRGEYKGSDGRSELGGGDLKNNISNIIKNRIMSSN